MNPFSYNGAAVVAMAGRDCVAIASDMRFGIQLQTVSTEFSKIRQFGPRVFVGFPGLATDTLTVSEKLTYRKNVYELNENKKIRPKTLCHMLSNLLYEQRFGTFFVEPVVAGIDAVTGQPFIGAMDLLGCQMEARDFAVSGTCTEQMYGLCETLWEPDMDCEQLFQCISQALLSALDRDCSSGWGAVVYLIEQDKVTVTQLKSRMD